MKQPHLVLKVAAVLSAVLLSGGFVSYRGGAFSWLAKPAPDRMLGSSKLKVLIPPSSPDAPNDEPAITSTSKALLPLAEAVSTPASEQPTAVPNQQTPPAAMPPTILASPKMGFVFPPEPTPPDGPLPAPSQPAKPAP